MVALEQVKVCKVLPSKADSGFHWDHFIVPAKDDRYPLCK